MDNELVKEVATKSMLIIEALAPIIATMHPEDGIDLTLIALSRICHWTGREQYLREALQRIADESLGISMKGLEVG